MHLFSPDPFLASQAAEAALAGKSGSNIALTSGTDSNGYFVDPAVTSVVNYDVNPNSSGTSIPFPGIPGATGSKENFAAEVLTYLQFPAAGFYQMAVRSDDGFRLTAGAPGDLNALVVGRYEGARESLDTIFGFQVAQAGVYPFRLLYYQGGGGASLKWLKWSSVSTAGDQVLINDPIDPTAIQAFRTVNSSTTNPPPVSITLQLSGGNAMLTWPGGGTLESSGDLKTWTTVQGAAARIREPPARVRHSSLFLAHLLSSSRDALHKTPSPRPSSHPMGEGDFLLLLSNIPLLTGALLISVRQTIRTGPMFGLKRPVEPAKTPSGRAGQSRSGNRGHCQSDYDIGFRVYFGFRNSGFGFPSVQF